MPMPLVARLPGSDLFNGVHPGLTRHTARLCPRPTYLPPGVLFPVVAGPHSPACATPLVSTGPPFVQREPPFGPYVAPRRRGVEMTAGFLPREVGAVGLLFT